MSRLASRLAAAALAASASAALAAPPTPAASAPAAGPVKVAQPFKDVGLWYGAFGDTICSWLDTGSGVFLIDTGSNAANAKPQGQIARTTKNKPVKWIALTHLHADSNDGLATFLPSDATIFVNAKTASLLVDFVDRLKGPPAERDRRRRSHPRHGREAPPRDRRGARERAHELGPVRLRRRDAYRPSSGTS